MQPDPHSHAPVLNFRTLAFREISRAFGRRRALSRISFECAAGEIAAVLGPNGAGKSTLLSIAATLLEPTSGVVEYGEHTARRAGAALRARIGLLGHDLYVYPELSAAENLAFFGRLYGIRQLAPRIEEAAAIGERVRRHIDDGHDLGCVQVNGEAGGGPLHRGSLNESGAQRAPQKERIGR